MESRKRCECIIQYKITCNIQFYCKIYITLLREQRQFRMLLTDFLSAIWITWKIEVTYSKKLHGFAMRTAETYLSIENVFFLFIKQEFFKKFLHTNSHRYFCSSSSEILQIFFQKNPPTPRGHIQKPCLRISTGIPLKILSEVLKI